MRKIVKNNKRHNEKNIVKKQTGITLIALIITIIVLLILAGVSIAMLTGNNGILTQAKLAKENTALAKEDEENKLAKNNEYINAQTGKVTPGVEVSKTEKNNYSDGTDTATVPQGFTVSGKKDEQTIANGLVIYDIPSEKVSEIDWNAKNDDGSYKVQTEYNQFVWVPVPDINSMSQCSKTDGSCNLQLDGNTLKCKTHNNNEEIVGKLYATEWGEHFGTVNTTYSADSGLREPAIAKNYDNDDSYNTIGLKLSNMQEDYKNMATNVAKYGGFYVGRYETSLTSATNESAGTTGTVQSKQGVIPTGSDNSATSMWYGLYKAQNKTYTGTNNSVESSMIWGSQYDRILNWAKEGNDKEKITNISLGNNSGGIVTTTGNSKYSNDSINNIRDLGGNLLEWTLEAYYAKSRVQRGGSCGSISSPSNRLHNFPFSANSSNGSRLTLYIK